MTPVGIWRFGTTNGVIWFRFIEHSFLLLSIAFLSLVLSLTFESSKRCIEKCRMVRTEFFCSVDLYGYFRKSLGCWSIFVPYFFVLVSARGGTVPIYLLTPFFLFALFGNFFEEVLFRVILQDYLFEKVGQKRSIFLSALFFATGHIFLATTVTSVGPLILIFTFWEGLICASLKPKYGIMASTIAHGLTIFILSSGLI